MIKNLKEVQAEKGLNPAWELNWLKMLVSRDYL